MQKLRSIHLYLGCFFVALSFIVSNAIADSPLSLQSSPSIQLGQGTTLSFWGVTYTNKHVPPGYENSRFNDMRYTGTNNTLMVWIKTEHAQKKWPSYELLVSDVANTAVVPAEKSTSTHVDNNVDIYGFLLSAYPRWDSQFVVQVAQYNKPAVPGYFVVANPAIRSPENWTPEPLPITKTNGDLKVTLTGLKAGVPGPYWQDREPTPTNVLSKQGVQIHFDFYENGRATTNWSPWLVRTTDAVGNQVETVLYGYPSNGVYRVLRDGIYLHNDGYFYQPGLWPVESAWRVRLEFTRISDFSDDEIVTFTNIPVKAGTRQDWDDEWDVWDVGKTNFPFVITPAMVNGVHLKLLPPLMTSDWNSSPGQANISVIIGADTRFPRQQGFRLTILEAKDDQGHDLWHPFNPDWAGHWSLDLPRLRPDIKTLTLKLALHKSRFVEFTVKPAK
ncbi:MAG TPA: hypothetical protein VGN23_17120 [Verrucomicrobiae bacterium]|jgi:hypothetical protein